MQHNVGFLFPEYFDASVDHFQRFLDAHQPQDLTESDKPGVSFRKGVYICGGGDEQQAGVFKLLRCSTNLSGPTERAGAFDRAILAQVNATARELFGASAAELNHVLAQIYYTHRTADNKERRARISRHADKTKDMPDNGLMCFCTFYDRATLEGNKKLRRVGHDVLYKTTSALNLLRFTLKDDVVDRPDLPRQFDVPLYPNSAFFISLETNRLFQHETVPPNIAVEDTPIRLGYVVRCSKQDAKFADGRMLIRAPDGGWVPLEAPTPDGVCALKELYKRENLTSDRIEYPFFPFSLNQGDYLEPSPPPLRDP